MRATVCISVDSEGEVRAADAWLDRWRDDLTYISDNQGCGCCVDIYDVDGPPEAIRALPPQIQAGSAWTAEAPPP